MSSCYSSNDDSLTKPPGKSTEDWKDTRRSSKNKTVSNKLSNCCTTCGKKQTWLSKFKKCGNCHLAVCKRCTIGGQNLIICGLCQASRRSHTSENWSFAAGLPRTNTRLRTNSKVRDYLEQLVAKTIGGSPPEISNESKPPIHHSGKYDKFCQTYHERLTKAIEELGKSLHLRPPIFDDDGAYAQPAAETANANFCKLLLEVKEAAMELAPFEDEQPVINKSLNGGETIISNTFVSTGQNTNYEEILSTAILNKVVSDVGLGGSRKSLSPVISVVDSAVQTDNDGELSATGSGKYNVKSWVTTTDGFSNFSDDDISLGTSSSNWSGGDGINQPVVHQIEEHVEITYETNETDSDTSQDEYSHHTQQRPRKTKKTKQQPVPFPEHGVDIIDSPDELEKDEPSRKVSQVLAWEENWLFKKKKKPIMFSKMAAESVPMLVPNPSISENDGVSVNDEDKSSDLEDNDFVGDYFEFPEEEKVNDVHVQNLDIKWPQDVHLATGKTARFSIIIPAGVQIAPPSWHCLTSKRILTTENEKIEIKADPPKYTLIIYNAQESDAGDYQVIVAANNKHSGAEVSRNFRLHVAKASEQRKKFPPTFNSVQDVVRIPKEVGPVSVNFELSGHPEPVLNIFKGNDILTTIEDKGHGRWSLLLNRDGSKFSQNIPGEYIAAATNTQGTTRVTFRIEEEEDDEEPEPTPALAIPDENSVDSQAEEDDNSSSSSSQAEETLKETSQSLVTNETVELQEDPNKRFTVAEREKQKWANPIKLEFNPYAPENLAKRIRAGRTSRELVLGASNTFEGSDNEPVEDVFFRTNKRDLKKQTTPEPNIVMVNKPLHTIPSDLGGVKLPSVRELAQQFSPVVEKNPLELPHPRSTVSSNTQKDVIRGIQLGRDFNVRRKPLEPSQYIPNSASLVSQASRDWQTTEEVTTSPSVKDQIRKWNSADGVARRGSSPGIPGSLARVSSPSQWDSADSAIQKETSPVVLESQLPVEIEEPIVLKEVASSKDRNSSLGAHLRNSAVISEPHDLEQEIEQQIMEHAAEQKRLEEAAEQKSLEEAAEQKRLKEAAEQQRLEEAAEQKRLEHAAEQKRLEEAAEQDRLERAAEQKRLEHAAEQQRLEYAAEQERLARAAEQQRLEYAAEQQRLEEAAEQQRLEEIAEQQRLEEIAEQQRLEDIAKQQRLEEIAKQQRLEEIAKQQRLEEIAKQRRQKELAEQERLEYAAEQQRLEQKRLEQAAQKQREDWAEEQLILEQVLEESEDTDSVDGGLQRESSPDISEFMVVEKPQPHTQIAFPKEWDSADDAFEIETSPDISEPQLSKRGAQRQVLVDIEEPQVLTLVVAPLPDKERTLTTSLNTGAPCEEPEEESVDDQGPPKSPPPPLPNTPPPRKILESIGRDLSFSHSNDSFSTVDSISPEINKPDPNLTGEEILVFTNEAESEREFDTPTPTPSSRYEDSGIEETQDESQPETPSSTPEVPMNDEEEEASIKAGKIQSEEQRKLTRNIVRAARFRKGGQIATAGNNKI